MNKNELSETLIRDTKNKKHYTSPKIEFISDIRDVTRGSVAGLNDGVSGGGTPPPSQVI